MFGISVAIWITLAMATTNVLGTVALKFSTDPDRQVYFSFGVVAYVIGAALYVSLLKEHSIALLAVVSSTLQLGLMISISIWLFDERVNLFQGTAMAVAIAASAVAMLANTH
jgi:drug/metabolite transporter (DMT)-like permease